MKIITIIIIFLLIGAFFIIANEHLRINTMNGFLTFCKLYWQWLVSVFNTGKEVTGRVVNLLGKG